MLNLRAIYGVGLLWSIATCLLHPCSLHAAKTPAKKTQTKARATCAVNILAQLQSLNRLRSDLNQRITLHNRTPFLFAVDVRGHVAIWKDIERAFAHTLGPEKAAALKTLSMKLESIHTLAQLAEFQDSERLLVQEARRMEKMPSKAFEQSEIETSAVGLVEILRRLENAYIRSQLPTAADTLDHRKENKEEKGDREEPERSPPQPSYIPEKEAYKTNHVDLGQSIAPYGRSIIATANIANLIYFEGGIFPSIDARNGAWYKQVLPHREIRRRIASDKRIHKVFPIGHTGEMLPIYIPEGYEPTEEFNNKAGSVSYKETGTWMFSTNNEFLEIPIVKVLDRTHPLSKEEEELYLKPTGMGPDDWKHTELQKFLKKLDAHVDTIPSTAKDRNVQIAFLLAQGISSIFTYDGKPRPEDIQLTPAEQVVRGKLQCATSCTVAASLLRERYKIPCRIREVHQAFHDPDHPGLSLHLSPNVGHSILEVPDANGAWHRIDPQPPHTDESKQKYLDNFQQNRSDGSPSKPNKGDTKEKGKGSKPADQSASKNKGKQASSQAGSAVTTDRHGHSGKNQSSAPARTFTDILEQATRRLQERAAQRPVGEKENRTETPTSTQRAKSSRELKSEQSILDALFAKEEKSFSPLSRRFLEGLVATAIYQDAPTEKKQMLLSALKGGIQSSKIPNMDTLCALLNDAITVFQGHHPSLTPWIMEMESLLRRKQYREASESLGQMIGQLRFTLQLADRAQKEKINRCLESAQRARKALHSQSDQKASSISIAEETFKVLGTASKLEVKEEYKFEGIGANQGTLDFAKALVAGKHTDLRLRTLLAPHTDFVSHPIRSPKRSLGRSPLDSVKLRPTQFQYSQDPRDALRARYPRLPDPTWTVEQAASYGLLPVERIPELVPIDSGTQDEANQNLLLVLWDASGSMSGNRARFVQEYLKAIVNRALANPSELVTLIFFIPFTGNVGTPIRLLTAEEALQAVMSQNHFGNQNGGTSIQNALHFIPQFVNRHIKKIKKLGKKLKAVTSVLFTDGEDTVNEAAVRAEFRKVSPNIEILLAYVATGTINQNLLHLVKREATGTDEGVFFSFSDEEIAHLIGDAETPLKEPKVSFWREKEVPKERLESILEAFAELKENARGMLSWDSEAEGNLKRLQQISERDYMTKRADLRPASKNLDLDKLRNVLQAVGPYLTPAERRKSMEWVAKQWGTLVSWEMDTAETNQLYWILNWIEKGDAFHK